MPYTEIQEKNGKKYYYRVISVRNGKKIEKKRIYLGTGLGKAELKSKEKSADSSLSFLSGILKENEEAFFESLKNKFGNEPEGNLENRYEYFCSLFTYENVRALTIL